MERLVGEHEERPLGGGTAHRGEEALHVLRGEKARGQRVDRGENRPVHLAEDELDVTCELPVPAFAGDRSPGRGDVLEDVEIDAAKLVESVEQPLAQERRRPRIERAGQEPQHAVAKARVLDETAEVHQLEGEEQVGVAAGESRGGEAPAPRPGDGVEVRPEADGGGVVGAGEGVGQGAEVAGDQLGPSRDAAFQFLSWELVEQRVRGFDGRCGGREQHRRGEKAGEGRPKAARGEARCMKDGTHGPSATSAPS